MTNERECNVTKGIGAIIYPVTDIGTAKKLFAELLGMQPEVDQPYYVGFKVDGLDVGLDPNGHRDVMPGPVAYWEVDDINASLLALLDAGAKPVQDVKDVGGGRLIAYVKDAAGNNIGIMQSPAS